MRLDLFLVEKLNIESRSKAQELIANQFVTVNEVIIIKPSFDITEENKSKIKIIENDFLKYVSRAGLKLEAAVQKLRLNVENYSVLDIGQSTGGFTDFLVQSKVNHVVGIDVGESQLHEKIKNYTNVTCFEKLNVKDISQHSGFLSSVPQKKFDLIVGDVSFISLNHVAPHITSLVKNNGEYLFLVKPQFECGRKYLNKNGIVKSINVYNLVQENITKLFIENFGEVQSYFESAILGKDGNKEFFIYGKNVKNKV